MSASVTPGVSARPDLSPRWPRRPSSSAGVFAEFERAMIQERVLAGLQRAAAEGKFPGRPIVGEDKEGAIRDCLAHGFGLIKTAKHVGVGVSVVRRRRRLLAQWWPDYQSRAEREVASAHARFLPWDG